MFLGLFVPLEERLEEIKIRDRRGFRPHRHRFRVPSERLGLLEDVLKGLIHLLVVNAIRFLLARAWASMASKATSPFVHDAVCPESTFWEPQWAMTAASCGNLLGK